MTLYLIMQAAISFYFSGIWAEKGMWVWSLGAMLVGNFSIVAAVGNAATSCGV